MTSNVGKWPSIVSVRDDWQKLATAFPFLDPDGDLYERRELRGRHAPERRDGCGGRAGYAQGLRSSVTAGRRAAIPHATAAASLFTLPPAQRERDPPAEEVLIAWEKKAAPKSMPRSSAHHMLKLPPTENYYVGQRAAARRRARAPRSARASTRATTNTDRKLAARASGTLVEQVAVASCRNRSNADQSSDPSARLYRHESSETYRFGTAEAARGIEQNLRRRP